MSANRMKLNTNKTELLWAGTKNCLSLHDGSFPCLQLGAVLHSRVRVLEVVISSDLSVEKHVSRVSASSFHYLRQLRRIRRSLNSDSVATLIHAFVTSRVDYCNAVFAGVPKVTTNKLQRVLNAAARVVTGTRKCDRGLSQLLHTELHWLGVPERVKYKLSVMVHRCLNGRAPQYLATLCVSVASVGSRQHLRSAARHQLAVPSYRLSTYGRRAVAVTSPMTWNALLTQLRRPDITTAAFGRFLKTVMFSEY